MKYYVRFALGLFLGLAAVSALWYLGHGIIAMAAGGAIVSVVGFLATFFVWSADRLDEGYEQVLFDGRNVVHALVLAVVLSGAGYGADFVAFGGGSAGPDAAELAAATAMASHRDDMSRIVAQYQSEAAAFRSGPAPEEYAEKLSEYRTRLADARTAMDALEVPPRLAPMMVTLREGADVVAHGLDLMDACAAGQTDACTSAQLTAAEWSDKTSAFRAAGETLGVLQAQA